MAFVGASAEFGVLCVFFFVDEDLINREWVSRLHEPCVDLVTTLFELILFSE